MIVNFKSKIQSDKIWQLNSPVLLCWQVHVYVYIIYRKEQTNKAGLAHYLRVHNII